MKALIYEYEKMFRAGEIMRQVSATGIDNFRLLKELGDILDSGKLGEYKEEKEGDDNAMECEKIRSD